VQLAHHEIAGPLPANLAVRIYLPEAEPPFPQYKTARIQVLQRIKSKNGQLLSAAR
jgi:hypothetical protein